MTHINYYVTCTHIFFCQPIIQYFIRIQVESYPLYQGLEKHYLRAQIARITAATQISPRDYFLLNYNSNSYKWKKLNAFQSKVMSQKCKYFSNHPRTTFTSIDLNITVFTLQSTYL